VQLVQFTPPGADLGLSTELAGLRCAPQLDEGRVGAVPKLEEIGVDRSTLPDQTSV
jgi:hypothetical protein